MAGAGNEEGNTERALHHERDQQIQGERDETASERRDSQSRRGNPPTIKELYTLISFRGTDLRPDAPDATGSIPFIDNDYFDFGYGDVSSGDHGTGMEISAILG